MESILQKWGWVGHLLIIAVAATLLANAVTRYIAIELAPLTVPELPEFAKKSPKASTTPKAKPRAKSFSQAIIRRCLFGCPEEAPDANACPDGCPDGQQCQAGECVEAPNSTPSELLVASALGVKLMGAMVADNAEFSLALFSDDKGKTTFILSIGDHLMGQAEVVDIRRDRVIVRNGSQLEYIKLENSLSGAPTLTSTVANLPPGATDIKRTPTGAALAARGGTPPAPATVTQQDKEKEKVKEVAEDTFELDSESVNAELGNAEKLAKAARVVPNYDENGKSAGIKLVGVRSDSVYNKLGIESGDVVTSIGGTRVKNQAHAFELLQGLKGKKNASIEIERRGQSKTLKYSVK